MQNRMKEHQLSATEIDALLSKNEVGRIATLNADGSPYITPVHFFHEDGTIYIHGLAKGTKISNIENNGNVCFELDQMDGLILDDKACDVNTKYQSVIAFGKATLLEDDDAKIEALQKIVGKYTPQLKGQTFPDEMLIMTGVIELKITTCTGKYYS